MFIHFPPLIHLLAHIRQYIMLIYNYHKIFKKISVNMLMFDIDSCVFHLALRNVGTAKTPRTVTPIGKYRGQL